MARALLVLGLAAAALLGVAGPASATYPGRPGVLAYSTDRSGGFDGSTSIWLQPLGGGKRRELTPAGGPEPEFERVSYSEPSWSPTGGRFVFTRAGGGVRVYITEDGFRRAREVPTGNGHAEQPSFGPDGRTIAFVLVEPDPSDDMARGPETIWTVRTDGSGLRKLREGGRPRWSPGGRRIYFSDPGDGCLMSMRSDGSDPRQVTSRCLSAHGDISPSGRRLAYTARAGSGDHSAAVFTIGLDGRGRRRVSPVSSFGVDDPVWAPDGASIAYHRRGRDSGLYRVGADGRGHRRIAARGGLELAWQPRR